MWNNAQQKTFDYNDKQLYNYGINRLAEREYLVAELRTKMLRMQPNVQQVDAALQKLIDAGLLSEDRAIQSYFYRYGQRESIHKTKQRLLQKGADKSLIEEYYEKAKQSQNQVDDITGELPELKAYTVLTKRYSAYDINNHQKMVRFLASRGFKYDEISKAINQLKSVE